MGDKWSLLVMRDLIMLGKRRFNELAEAPEGIATNVLTARLRVLEEQGIITRRSAEDDARQVIYEPTEKGLALLPVMLELARWSATYDPDTAAPKGFAKQVERDRQGLIDGFVAGVTMDDGR